MVVGPDVLFYTFGAFLSDSLQNAEHRLLDLWAIHDLTPDAAEVEASRAFHIEYWLRMAESAIAGDHRKSCYDSLTPNIRSLIETIPNPLSADRETIALLRKELAFLEGHVTAYRQIVEALRGLGRPTGDQDCGWPEA
jgi:hypothetical protein